MTELKELEKQILLEGDFVDSINDSKQKGHIEYGDRIRIYWKQFVMDLEKDLGFTKNQLADMSEEEKETERWSQAYDVGIVVAIPQISAGNPDMDAVVFIPKPIGGEKEASPAEMVALNYLLSLEDVDQIEKEG